MYSNNVWLFNIQKSPLIDVDLEALESKLFIMITIHCGYGKIYVFGSLLD